MIVLADNDYHFITRWRVESTVDEVFKILDDPFALMRWWPCVYLEVKVEPTAAFLIGDNIKAKLKASWYDSTSLFLFSVPMRNAALPVVC